CGAQTWPRTPLTRRRLACGGRAPPRIWTSLSSLQVSPAVAVLQEDAVAMALGDRIGPIGRGRDGGGERTRLVVEEALDGPEIVLDLRAARPRARMLEQAKRELLDRLARGPAEHAAP